MQPYSLAAPDDSVIDGDQPQPLVQAPWWWLPVLWLTRQNVRDVILMLILGGNAWVVYHCLTVAVPQHLDKIQQGYDRNITQMERALDKQNAAFTANLKYLVDSFREAQRERRPANP